MTKPTLFESVTSVNPEPKPDRSKFFDQKSYTEAKWKAELHNRDSFLWLWKAYQDEKDSDKRHALETKMSQFKAFITRQTDIYQSLRIDFQKYPFSNPKQPAERSDWND